MIASGNLLRICCKDKLFYHWCAIVGPRSRHKDRRQLQVAHFISETSCDFDLDRGWDGRLRPCETACWDRNNAEGEHSQRSSLLNMRILQKIGKIGIAVWANKEENFRAMAQPKTLRSFQKRTEAALAALSLENNRHQQSQCRQLNHKHTGFPNSSSEGGIRPALAIRKSEAYPKPCRRGGTLHLSLPPAMWEDDYPAILEMEN